MQHNISGDGNSCRPHPSKCAILNRKAREWIYGPIVLPCSSTRSNSSRGGFWGADSITLGGFIWLLEWITPHFHKGTMDQATSPNQRRFRRYGGKLPCRVKPRASHKSAELPELKVETLDVSSGGLFFLASAEWSIGTAIEFELELPAHGVRRPVKMRC